jgi:hypothetical protein
VVFVLSVVAVEVLVCEADDWLDCDALWSAGIAEEVVAAALLSVAGGGVVELLVAGVWLLTGGVAVADDWLLADVLASLCGIAELEVVSGGLVLLLGLDVSGGVVLLAGGVVVLGEVLVLGDVLLLGLFTSLCGTEPVLLQSDEIIFTLLTVIEFELEDDGLALPAAVPVALPLPEVVPATSIM